jgi:hypothetical protein
MGILDILHIETVARKVALIFYTLPLGGNTVLSMAFRSMVQLYESLKKVQTIPGEYFFYFGTD